MSNRWEQLQTGDREAVWHPYSPSTAKEIFPVIRAEGVRLQLADERQLIDGMSSWWCAIHGYNHPVLNDAVKTQLDEMSHVMFGGLTHPPAVALARLLVDITPSELTRVFFSDSGSVAVEVAIKMAVQFWHGIGKPRKRKLVALRNAYHGDTYGAMSLCDPVTGMHHLFGDTLTQQLFAPQPACRFEEKYDAQHLQSMSDLLTAQADDIAAVIVEPVVQGAGGMYFYAPEYLVHLQALCAQHDVLLIFDEIATGFGRTGKLFAMEHAGVTPDIVCLGKALTGGYMTLAATLCNDKICNGIDRSETGAFMHGPTFMANPLACAAAIASIKLLLSHPWQRRLKEIEKNLFDGLEPARELGSVTDVRVLGGIGVIELNSPVDMAKVQPLFVEQGVWVRPFGKLVYTMPAYVMNSDDVATLTSAMVNVVAQIQ
ncbi:MAG: adenosylmethionine--8-amino-7-oxononanoate transaminase [Halieaceae bacterium]|nr:adenosylmethionine--8-amino-7-oxononanoate transaminase [Halieaceae bacterium]